MKEIFLILGLLSVPAETTNPNNLVDFVISATDKVQYECLPIQAPIDLCIDPKSIPENARAALRKAIVRISLFFQNNVPALQCLQSIQTPEKTNFVAALREAFQLKKYEETKIPGEIFITGYGTTPIGTTKKIPIVFAYSKFFEAQRLSGNPYVSIGFNRDVLENPSSGISTNSEYLSAMLTIGILKNMGIEESQLRPDNDPVVKAAECILFNGPKPDAYHLPGKAGGSK